MRAAALLAIVLGCTLQAATLEYLSIEDMSRKSTTIVRGKVTGCSGEVQRSVIFTHCSLTASEVWKGAAGKKVEFYVPGGHAKGLLQKYTGTPLVNIGQEYLFFLWAGPSGLNQIIGLSQGSFTILTNSKGTALAKREASGERIVDAGGLPVQDQGIEMNLESMRQKVQSSLASRGAAK